MFKEKKTSHQCPLDLKHLDGKFYPKIEDQEKSHHLKDDGALLASKSIDLDAK